MLLWRVEGINQNKYRVIYLVDQSMKEEEEIKYVKLSYEVMAIVDYLGDIIIIKNPTISSIPSRFEYE
ncbi:MAG: conjugal transfer protein [Clostridium paraputrificum]